MPHAIYTGMSPIWYHTDRHEQQWKRVALSVFFQGPSKTDAPKMCLDQSQTFKEVRNRYLVGIYCRNEKKINFPVDEVTVSVDEETGKSVFLGREN